MSENENKPKRSLNFIEQIIEEHNRTGRFDGTVMTRFPPEPNGYLHIGHAKSLWLNFNIAKKYGGSTNLRFDDTNPVTEDTEFVNSIQNDIKWLGHQWDNLYFASDYFDQLYDWAIILIKKGKAYVDHSSAEDMDRMKKAGEASPYRNRSVDENLDLFEQMKNGALDEGTCVLRAKIDMQAENWLLRDPILYRIKKAQHHRTGDKWNIYPMYDFAHGQSDAIEGITHSLCTLEFEVHRPVYEWLLTEIDTPNRPQQIEFSRLNVAYTVTSKRKLKELIELGKVAGWDDPRLHTIAALRRRGYTPEAVNDFIDRAGISKREQQIDLSSLEFSVREDLNKKAPRVMAVLNPIKLVITNYPEGQVEHLGMINNPEDDSQGRREVPFSRELWIERDDFMENPPPPKKFYRLGPDRKVRLKGGYIVHCDNYDKDADGNITTVYCSYFPDSKSGEDTSGIKVKGTIHWVCVDHAKDVEVRLYDRLFTDPNPVGHKDTDYKAFLNPNSLEIITAKAEPHLAEAKAGDKFQFLRKGYFVVDPDSTDDHLVFNRTVTLRDNWKKKQ